MAQDVTTFNFAHGSTTQGIRTVTIDGEPWFFAPDVCRVLGRGNPTMALRPLGADEKRTLIPNEGSPDNRNYNVISESGLYKLAMRSDKLQAKPFQDWVTKVVLPAIRKDGAYVMDEEKVATGELSEDELVLRAVSILQAKVERLRKEKEAALAKVAELAPKADIVDQYMDAKGTLNSSQVAKMLGFSSAQQLHQLAVAHRILYPVQHKSGQYLPYGEYAGAKKGFFQVTTGQKNGVITWTQTRWTPKGVAMVAMKFGHAKAA